MARFLQQYVARRGRRYVVKGSLTGNHPATERAWVGGVERVSLGGRRSRNRLDLVGSATDGRAGTLAVLAGLRLVRRWQGVGWVVGGGPAGEESEGVVVW